MSDTPAPVEQLRAVLEAAPTLPRTDGEVDPRGLLPRRDSHALAALGSLCRELLAVVDAFDRIAWMAEQYAEAGGSGGPEMRDYAEAMVDRATLDAAIVRHLGEP